MILSQDKIDTLSVIVAKSEKDIDSFFDDSVDASEDSGIVLSTGNGNLIQFDHSFGAGIGRDQNIVLRFADTGGQTLQKLFSINIKSLIEKSKINSRQDLFLISYGAGSDRGNWSDPSYHYIYNADYEILTDGLEITTLYLSPSVLIQNGADPLVATDAITKAFKENVSEVIGEVNAKGDMKFNSIDDIVDSVIELYRKGAEQIFGLNAVIKMPKSFVKKYLDREIAEATPPTDGSRSFGDEDLNSLSVAAPDYDKFNIKVDNSNSIIVDKDESGQAVIRGWNPKASSLFTLLQLPGIQLTAEDVPLASTDSPDKKKADSKSPPEGGTKDTPKVPDGASKADAGIAEADWETESKPPEVKTSLVINLSLDFRQYEESFSATFSRLFDALRAGGGYEMTLQNKDVWQTPGKALVELQPTIFIQNNASILKEMVRNDLLDSALAECSVVFLGDITTILETFGDIGTGQAKIEYDMAYKEESDSGTPKLKPYASSPLVLETSKNILSFQSNTRLPAIGFFKNNTFYKDASKIGTKEEYKTFIQKYLKEAVTRFALPEKDNPFSDEVMEYYDYEQIAEDLFERLDTLDADAVGNSFIATDTKYSGLLTYLYMYYNYVALGTVLGTVTTLPYFKYSHPGVLGQNVLVRIRSNPSPYDHLIDKEYNSYNSGLYKLQGFKHSISNSQATSTFYLRRISLK